MQVKDFSLLMVNGREELVFSKQNRRKKVDFGTCLENQMFPIPTSSLPLSVDKESKASQQLSALNSSSLSLSTAEESKASQQLSALDSSSFPLSTVKEAETDQLVKETFSRFFSEILSLSKEMNEKINSLQMNFVERGQLSGIYPLTEGNLKDILTTLSQEEKETLFKEIASASLFSRKLPAESNQRIISQIISLLEGKEGEGNLKDILTTLSQEEKETLAHLYPKEEVLFPLTGENRENSEKIALGQEEILFSVKQREELRR